jgi:3-hydroxyisobutyrate dehydrogenase-like beta-hydroxyacid dehydrogenase
MTDDPCRADLRVGFIGLGSQGAPMARRIVDAGYPLALWARRPASVEPFADTPAVVVATPAEVGAASDLVGVCVVDDAGVETVVLGDDGVLAGMVPGGIVAIHSTVHPATCRRLASVAAAQGISVVDAPVSGGGGAAAERRLLVMVGGDDAAVARCRPVFATFGDPIVALGGVGSGQLAKLVNNLVFTAQIAVALDTLAVADRLDVDRAALAEVLAHGSGGSRTMAILAATGFATAGIAQAAPLLRKDVGLVLDLLAATPDPPPSALTHLAETALTTLESRRAD